MPDGYLVKQQNEAEKYSFEIQKEANEAVKELNKHLILFSTAILSFSLYIFQNEKIVKNIIITDKYILIFIWILLGLSIPFRIAQFYTDYNFFKKWNKTYKSIILDIASERITEKIRNTIDEDMKDETISQDYVIQIIMKKYKSVIKEESSIFCIKFQVTCVSISLCFLLYVMGKLLFIII